MNHITYRISLDLRKTDSGVVVKVKRDDTVKKLAISLTDGGKPYHITEDCSAKFAGEKPDGTILFNPCSIEDCVVTYEITPQTIAELGEVESEIRLYSTAGDLVTSPSFTILVVPPVYDDDRVIESHDEVNALTELITSAAGTIQKGEEVIQEGNELLANLQEKGEALEARAEEAIDGLQEAQEELAAEAKEVFDSMPTTYVSFDPQNPTAGEAAQARKNIGAVSTAKYSELAGIVQGLEHDVQDVDEAAIKKDTEASVSSLKILHDPETNDAIFAEGSVVSDKDDLLVDVLTLRGCFEGSVDNALVIVRNVHAGENPTDAVNLQQLNEAVGGKKVYEQIATITVTADADGNLPQHVIFSADSEGNPFELTDFIVQARAGFVDGSKSGLYMSVNKNRLAIGNSAVSGISATPRSFTIFYRQENDGSVRAEHTVSGSSTSFYNPASSILESRVAAPEVMTGFAGKTVTKIDLYTLTGDTKAWVEGSTFELWGVRA